MISNTLKAILLVGFALVRSLAFSYDITSANSTAPLGFLNYLGNHENIHPKVLYFEHGWNGYEYWMAYTPYPGGATDAENPCIAVSHDGIQWTVPAGLVNPLAQTPEHGYNSDTHLLYDKENDLLEIWWRPYDRESNSDAAFRRVSSDGVNWSAPEVMLPFGSPDQLRLSPAVWKDGSLYTMIYSDGRVLRKSVLDSASDVPEWSESEILPIDWGNLKAWHHDAILDEDGNLEMVVCAFGPGGSNNQADLYYVRLDATLTHASKPKLILERSKVENSIDSRSIYRSSLVKLNGGYRLYYSCINQHWERFMAVAQGVSPEQLCGLSPESLGSELIINEIMHSNVDCVLDDLNEFPVSWVELYNPTPFALNLREYCLGVQSDSQFAWNLDKKYVYPEDYALIYCDGKARKYHTNFSLDPEGFSLFLFHQGVLIDSVENIPAQLAPNVSYGRVEQSVSYGFQLEPSPGQANVPGSVSVLLGEPVFSSPGRIGSVPVSLELALPENSPPDAVIRYTLDGSEPNSEAEVYSAPIEIRRNCVVRAKLFSNQGISPRSSTHSFISVPAGITLPVISLVSDPEFFTGVDLGILSDNVSFGKYENRKYRWSRPANLEYFVKGDSEAALNQLCLMNVSEDESFRNSFMSLVFHSDARLGNSFFNFEFFPEKKPGISRFRSLKASNGDNDFARLFLRDEFAQSLIGENADIDWQASQPCVVFLNGEYFGMLNLKERPTEDYFVANYDGLEQVDLIENFEKVRAGSVSEMDKFIKLFSDGAASFSDFNESLDIESFLNLFIINMYLANYDAIGSHALYWKPSGEGGKWRCLADRLDSSMGPYLVGNPGFDYLDWIYNPTDYPAIDWGVDEFHTRLHRTLLAMPEFRDLFIDRFAVYMGDFLSVERATNKLMEMSDALRPEWSRHFDKNIKPGYPTADFDVYLRQAKSFLSKRSDVVYDQLASRFGLGNPVPLVVADDDGILETFSIQDIEIVNDSFSGKFFEGRSVKISRNPSFDSFIGWVLEVEKEDNSVSRNTFFGDSFVFTVPEAVSVSVYPLVNDTMVKVPSGPEGAEGAAGTPRYFSLDGLPVAADSLAPGIYLRRYPDGHTEKIVIRR